MDLAGDATIDNTRVNLTLDEHKYRLSQRQSLFSSAICFVALLFLVAVVYGGFLLVAVLTHPTSNLHWHASILIAAFIAPPTITLIALMRLVYAPEQKEAETPALTPALSMVKEAAGAVAAVFKTKP